MAPWRFALAVGCVVVVLASVSWAADVPGSKDPPNFKRFEGSEIIHYATRGYDQYLMARAERGFDKSERTEGAVIRIIYRVPEGRTAIEVFRNYQRMVAEAGLTQTFELATGSLGGPYYIFKDFADRLFFQGEMEARKAHEVHPFRDGKNPYYFTAKGTKAGEDITVAVLAAESAGGPWREPGVSAPYQVKPGQVVVAVDVITAKTIEDKMVVVKATDIAEALATKGKIDLYGIYFDVDKTNVKAESGKTLEEVASLLKIDRSLKLEISGHTDNTGSADHNMKLSEGRAKAVVDALVKTYGIDGARLRAKGYGDTKPVGPNSSDEGRAKNRRVELRKI